jgi:hypothetical protein
MTHSPTQTTSGPTLDHALLELDACVYATRAKFAAVQRGVYTTDNHEREFQIAKAELERAERLVREYLARVRP